MGIKCAFLALFTQASPILERCLSTTVGCPVPTTDFCSGQIHILDDFCLWNTIFSTCHTGKIQLPIVNSPIQLKFTCLTATKLNIICPLRQHLSLQNPITLFDLISCWMFPGCFLDPYSLGTLWSCPSFTCEMRSLKSRI